MPGKLVRLTEICLNETFSAVCIAKNLSDKFPIQGHFQQGDALSPLLFIFVFEYAVERVRKPGRTEI
jgi:hypothetical protein